MKKNAAKIKIKVSDRGAICLELIDSNKLAYTANRYKVHIINYITCFNKFAEENILKPESTAFGNGKSCIAYLSYYSFTDLFSNTRGLYKMNDIDLEEYATAADKDRRTALDAPTIHMTLGNILSDEDNPIDEPFKRFARYMDSSIWNYYAPIIVKVDLTIPHGLNPNRYDFSYFIFAIQAIINNSFYKTPQGITNLYEINVTKEYADINERILMQSKLMEVSGHSKNVSPFLFHSEQKLQKEIAKGHEKLIENIKQYKWRILLVDDHAITPLRIGELHSKLSKSDIIIKELSKVFGEGNVTTDSKRTSANIYIDCVSTIDEAQQRLKRKKYEIVLLDYLLDQRKEGEGREYGYELLDIIKKEEDACKQQKRKPFYKKGPNNRFYFMFISAFTTAVSERLLTEGWARSEKYWYIGEGACPINTPYLFQYRLLHIMQKRMETMGIQELDGICSLFKNTEVNFLESEFYKNIVNEIYCTEEIIGTKKGNVRKRANDKFQEVLNLLYSYKNLLNDTQITHDKFIAAEESVLATDFVVKNLSLGAFLEHFTQLVYLTAFGTVRQWSEMWEEYQFIKSMVGPIKCIENYIVGLKNNSIK